MNRSTARSFFSLPSVRRVLCLSAIGLLLILIAYRYRVRRRPKELSAQETADGLARVRAVIDLVRRSGFGQTERGRRLTDQARGFLEEGRIKFSADLGTDALWRKEFGSRPVLYIGVFRGRGGIEWPAGGELAKRIYHEALHETTDATEVCKEEECDAFCAAEEAAAAVEGRSPEYPVTRDGQPVWEWVQTVYADNPSDTSYQPVGYTLEELAVKTGIDYVDATRPIPPETSRESRTQEDAKPENALDAQ